MIGLSLGYRLGLAESGRSGPEEEVQQANMAVRAMFQSVRSSSARPVSRTRPVHSRTRSATLSWDSR